MEKLRPWCGQSLGPGRLKNRTRVPNTETQTTLSATRVGIACNCVRTMRPAIHRDVVIHTGDELLCKVTNTHPFNGPLSGTTRVSRYQKGKTSLDSTEARDSEWQWHQLGHMQVCTSLQSDNHASTPPLSFLQAGCPSCRPTNSVKALK